MFNFTTSTKGRRQTLPTDPASQALAGQGQEPVPARNQTAGSPPAPAAVPPEQAGAQDPYVEQRIAEIEAQRQAFMRKNPDFDMKSEMQNPDFVNYVWGSGLTVEDAFFLVHRDELLEQARAEALEELTAHRDRIPENGAGKNRPAIAKKNPKDLSDKEIDAIITRARNGEKITF